MPPPKLSRREARALKANLEAAKEQEKKVRFVARVISANEPRSEKRPDTTDGTPRVAVDPAAIFLMRMTWCITKSDCDGCWSWNEARQWTISEFATKIKPKLDTLTKSTWSEIHQFRSNGLATHHDQAVSSLISEAQSRWAEKGIDTDTTFRFRLSGKQRVWGFREGSHFRLVWYDRFHRLYPTEKSNT